MSRKDEWVKLSEYGTRTEAEIYAELLEAAEIPVVIRGPETGIFGPGFAGPTSRGVSLLVLRSSLEDALDLIEPRDEETELE